jgi:hypothetical protein
MSPLSQSTISMRDHIVLLAEQDAFVLSYLAAALKTLGMAEVLVAGTAEEADRFLLAGDIAVAAIGESVAASDDWRLARSLTRRGVPFIFMSARAIDVATDLTCIAVMTWPFAGYQLFDALTAALRGKSVRPAKG